MYRSLLGPVFLFWFVGSTGKILWLALVLFHKNIELHIHAYKHAVNKGRNVSVDTEEVASDEQKIYVVTWLFRSIVVNKSVTKRRVYAEITKDKQYW